MKKTTTVAILLFISLPAFCSSLNKSLQKIESTWAFSYYQQDADQQKASYSKLLKQAKELSDKYPKAEEPKIWQAVLLSTNAAYETPFTALSSLNKAKELLEEAIIKQPRALQGTAFVTLGTLYYMTPSWPVAFGDV